MSTNYLIFSPFWKNQSIMTHLRILPNDKIVLLLKSCHSLKKKWISLALNSSMNILYVSNYFILFYLLLVGDR